MAQKGDFLIDGTSLSVKSAEAPKTQTDGRDFGPISAQGPQGKGHLEVQEIGLTGIFQGIKRA
jgi:hypothetical protein